ncbi:MAG: hypothetical protein ACRESA_08925 [Gammaproteobacteria bacterium]
MHTRIDPIFAPPKDIAEACGNSIQNHYKKIADGLLPPMIKSGKRKSLAVVGEYRAVCAAQISGATNDEIRALVRQIVADRSKATAQ